MKGRAWARWLGAAASFGFATEVVLAFCHEQGWVGRAIEIFVPTVAGSGTDALARQAAGSLAAQLGHEVLVRNAPGAGGALAVGAFAESEPGPQVILLSARNIASITSNDPATIEMLIPIAQLTEEPFAVVARPNSRIETLADFTAALRTASEPVSVGGLETGGLEHIALALISEATGASASNARFIPFASVGETTTALVSGQMDVAIVGALTAKELAAAEDGRVLAVTSAERVSGIDAPTLQEADIEVEFTNWRGVFGRPDMPVEHRDEWAAAFADLARQTEWNEFLAIAGFEPAFIAGEEFAASVESFAEATIAARATLGVQQ